MIKTTKITGIIASILIIISVIVFYLVGGSSDTAGALTLKILALVTGITGGLFLIVMSILAELTYKYILIIELISSGLVILSMIFLLIGVQEVARYYLTPLSVVTLVLVSITTLLKVFIVKIVYK